jgi:hypothetical protein
MTPTFPPAETTPATPVAAPRDGDTVARLLALRPPSAAMALLIVALWLITRPYRGVRHDAVLYLGQTLAHSLPDTIGRDLFLAFGSQDRYSMFSQLMAPLVQGLGIATSEMGLLVVCQAAFVAACWQLTADLPSRFLRWCALLLLTALSHTYAGGGGSFAFAEPFLSARSLAEPLALLSLGLLLRGRIAWTMLPMVAAISLHALIALPALLTAWVTLCLRDRRWWGALAVLPLIAGAGALGVAPFDNLWHRFDADWWTNVRLANSNVFIMTTRTQDWGTAGFDLILLYLASRLLTGTALALMLRALLICAPVLTLLWGVGADLVQDVLLTQLQVWRIYWLTHLFAILVLPLVLLYLWRRPVFGRWAVAGFALAALAVSANLSTQLLCLLWALLPLLLLRFPAPVSAGLARLATGVSCLAMLLVSANVGWHTHSAVAAFPERFNGVGDVQIVLGLSVVVGAIGYVVMLGLAASGARRWLSMVALLGLVAAGGAWWDQRSDWQRFVEGGLHEHGMPFEGMTPSSAAVYWDDSLIEPWLLMQRRQFFAAEQGAGLLFSRPTAMEYAAAQNAIRPMIVQQQVCRTVGMLTGVIDLASCGPTLDIIREICSSKPRRPDYMVFRAEPGSDGIGAAAVWTFRPGDAIHSRSYRLYDCAKLR